MITVLLILAAVAAFGVLIFLLIDHEVLGWGRRRQTPARSAWPVSSFDTRSAGRDRPESQVVDSEASVILTLLGCGALVVALYLGVISQQRAWDLNLTLRASSLPAVTGEVMGVDLAPVGRGRSSAPGWRPVVTYRYTVDGRTYTSDVWRANPPYLLDQSRAEEILATYRPGDLVQVLYDPLDPSRATLDPGFVPWLDYVETLFGLAFTVLSLLFGVLMLASLTPALRLRVEAEQEERELMRAILRQRRTPRAVRVDELIPTFYRPWLHALSVVVAGGAMWLILGPLVGLSDTWLLVAISALWLGVLVIWPFYALRKTLWALRHGYDTSALVTEFYLKSFRGGTQAQVRWRVRGPTGEFEGRSTIHGRGHEELREGQVVRVLVHPSRPTVLRVVNF